jgi:hypothetical protein
VLARVVAGADGVIADLVLRPPADLPLAAVAMGGWPIVPAMISPNLRAVPLGESSFIR